MDRQIVVRLSLYRRVGDQRQKLGELRIFDRGKLRFFHQFHPREDSHQPYNKVHAGIGERIVQCLQELMKVGPSCLLAAMPWIAMNERRIVITAFSGNNLFRNAL